MPPATEWLRAKGMNPFEAHDLPLVSMWLTQAVGRLIRRESDTGRITILDRRVVTRRYGHALLNNLPPMKRSIGQKPASRHVA